MPTAQQYIRGATPSPVPPEPSKETPLDAGVDAEKSPEKSPPDSKADSTVAENPDWAFNAFGGDPFADIDPPVLTTKG